ncbi:MAG: bifunctional phosphopantothenoylcysteine decarboxylase/phosphopantothenate--cysteine ligase CoaBC [Oscillospiraceae bacterium]|nr:bifunctional phosphopantothenoylcysteine decarboxylase/phosphopantothenate--cysteine ligase CoaBC [Oscillospiraceae bacterium]
MQKTVVMGICGGIAAYKAVYAASSMVKKGLNVKVIMTKSATEFVTPLTFQTITKNKVITDMFSLSENVTTEHISLAKEADVFLICPATANVIGKIASGIADDFLTTTVMATKAKVVFAPAMNTNMYENPIVEANINKLKYLQYEFVEPECGILACGDSGKGRLAEIDDILDKIDEVLCDKKDFAGKKVLVTAGATKEAIDPVRYITNHSTGKMGYAVAKAAKMRGADVTLVSGSTNLRPFSGVTVINVTSAEYMYNAVMEKYPDTDIVVKAAAVADFTPEKTEHEKIKKTGGEFILPLKKTEDILSKLGALKVNQFLVGFCMETSNLIENAKKKLESKNLDLIAANSLNCEGAGFGTDTNVITLISKDGKVEQYEKMSKYDAANIILDKILEKL